MWKRLAFDAKDDVSVYGIFPNGQRVLAGHVVKDAPESLVRALLFGKYSLGSSEIKSIDKVNNGWIVVIKKHD